MKKAIAMLLAGVKMCIRDRRLKDQYGAEVTVITMGLPKAEEVLREAMAMGADNGILVTDRVPVSYTHLCFAKR